MILIFLAFKVVLILLLSSEISAYDKFDSEYYSKDAENNFDDDMHGLNLHDFRLLKKIITGSNDYKRVLFLKKSSNHLLAPLVEVYKALLFIKPGYKETNWKSKLSSLILKDILNNLSFHENKWKSILIKTDKDVSLKSKKDSTTTSETPEPKNSLTINNKILSKNEDFPQILKYTPRNKKPYILSRKNHIRKHGRKEMNIEGITNEKVKKHGHKLHAHKETEPKSFQENKKTLENIEDEDVEFTYTPEFEFIKQDSLTIPEDILKTKESELDIATTGKAVSRSKNVKVPSIPREEYYPKFIKSNPSDKGVKNKEFSVEKEYADENVESTEDIKEDKDVNSRENKHKSIESTRKIIEKNNFVNKEALSITKEKNYPIVFKVKPRHKAPNQDINKSGEKNKRRRKEQNISKLNQIEMTSNLYQEIKYHSPKSTLETPHLENSNKIAHGMSRNYPIVFRITPSAKNAKVIPLLENDKSRSENKDNFLVKPMVKQAIRNLKTKSKNSKTRKNFHGNSRKFHLKLKKGSLSPFHFIMKNELLTNKIGQPKTFHHPNVDTIPMLNLPKIIFNRHESQNVPFKNKDMENDFNEIEQFRNIKYELPSKIDKFYSDISKENQLSTFSDEQLSNDDNSYYNANHGEKIWNDEIPFRKFSQDDIKKPKVKEWDIFYRNPFFEFYL